MGVKRKKPRRRSKSAAMYLPIAALLVIFLVIFGTSAFLKITEIEVIGASKYTDGEIISASGIVTGDNMLFIDRKNAQMGIKSLPYVSEVPPIRYRLPDKIVIEIKESVPVAAVSFQGRMLLIDSGGKILEQVGSTQGKVIEIRGIAPVSPVTAGSLLKVEADSETRLKHMTDVLKAIENAEIQDDVWYLDVTNITNITFGYIGKLRVRLGSTDDLQYKLSRVVWVMSDELDINTSNGAVIDASDPSRTRLIPD